MINIKSKWHSIIDSLKKYKNGSSEKHIKVVIHYTCMYTFMVILTKLNITNGLNIKIEFLSDDMW